ncbi:MAG: hypothetical protein LBN04_00935 [Oscillospiraceae bacterium]|jgi:hypothetical protein|nr:hypothetical protein [Oscillospiraceae bacterium]
METSLRVLSWLMVLTTGGYAITKAACALRMPGAPPRPVMGSQRRWQMAIVCLVVLTRAALYLWGMLAVPPQADLSGIERFVEHWRGADVEHFVRIAEHGYEPGTEYANRIVFFPMLPLLMRLVGFVLPFGVEFAGIVVGNIALLGACLLLFRLCLSHDMEPIEGFLAVCFLLAFPFGVFLQMCYTEPPFLLFSIGCVLAARRGRWLPAGALGMLAALTRNMGVLLVVPAAYEYLRQREAGDKGLRAVPLLLIPAGLGVYLGLNAALYGDALAFLGYQQAAPWYQNFALFSDTVVQQVGMALEHPALAPVIYVPQLLLFFAVLGALGIGARMGISPGLVLLGGLLVLASYSASWLISGGRYMLAVFPMYMALARFARRHPLAGGGLLTASATLMLTMAYLLLNGYAIM